MQVFFSTKSSWIQKVVFFQKKSTMRDKTEGKKTTTCLLVYVRNRHQSRCYSCMAAVEWLSSNSLLKLHLWLPPGYTISSNFQCTYPTWSVKHPPGSPLEANTACLFRIHPNKNMLLLGVPISAATVIPIFGGFRFQIACVKINKNWQLTGESWCFPLQFLSGVAQLFQMRSTVCDHFVCGAMSAKMSVWTLQSNKKVRKWLSSLYITTAIFLGSFRLPYEEIRDIVLEVDEERLSESLIQVRWMFTVVCYALLHTFSHSLSHTPFLFIF